MNFGGRVVIAVATAFSLSALGELEGIAQTCPIAAPVVLATGIASGAHPQVDDQYVYFIAFPGLFRVDKAGGAPVTLDVLGGQFMAGSGGPGAFDLLIDATHIYVKFPGMVDLDTRPGSVLVYDKAGTRQPGFGTLGQEVTGDCDFPFISDFALAPNGDLYWLQHGGDHRSDSSCTADTQSELVWVPAGASEPALLLRTLGGASQVRADDAHVFWMDGSIVGRLPRGGGHVDVLDVLPAQVGLPSMSIDASNLYWSSFVAFGNEVTERIAAPLARQTIATVAFDDLLADGTYLYGNVRRNAPDGGYTVMRMKTNGHGMTAIARSGGNGIAYDDTFVYYFDQKRQQLMKACRLP